MSNTLEYAKRLVAIKNKVSELDSLLTGDFGYRLNQVLESYTSLFDRFCPYKIGDRVKLKETLDIPKGSGWYGSRHFLIKGAIATVRTCEYQKDSFCFGLEFDDESWIDMHGEVTPSSSKHLFHLSENCVERAI